MRSADQLIALRLTSAMLEAIDAEAERNGTNRSAVVRQALAATLEVDDTVNTPAVAVAQ